MKVDLYFRNPYPTDFNFIKNSWLRSLCDALVKEQMIEKGIFYSNHAPIVDKLLDKSRVVFACNPEDLEQTYGYIVYQQIDDLVVIHCIYVKHPFRRYGIASKLFNLVKNTKSDLPCIATHYSPLWSRLLKKKFGLVFNPYILTHDL